MKTPADRALDAAIDQARVTKRIKELTNVIASAVCDNKDAHHVLGCLYVALHETVNDDPYYSGPRGLDNDEILEAIADCEPCRRAYDAIKERKRARAELGHIRRRITMLGKHAAARKVPA